MLSKQHRFDLVQLMFNYIFRLDNQFDSSLEEITQSCIDQEEELAITAILDNFDGYKSQIEAFLLEFGWSGTPFLSRAILIVFWHEYSNLSDQELPLTSKLITEYLHLTQELAGAECVPLVHAVIGKLTQSQKN